MSFDPWFSSWNYQLFQALFNHVPHTKATDDWCEALISNPALSTWVFSFCFYRYWTKNDSQRPERRCHLTGAMATLGVTGLITIILRPWIHWPAPVLNAKFQALFPQYLWGNGNGNCFPSHSTLVYFTIAVGFWPLSRRLSLSLATLTLALISFPRVYEGGHYPIDVAFSCFLTIATAFIVWRWRIAVKISEWIAEKKLPGSALLDLIFFGWLFEVAEGFHSVEFLTGAVRHALLTR